MYFLAIVRSVFLSESVLDPVYRGAVILLPWGELIQKRAGHDCRFNDLRLCHYFPRLAHRGLFEALPICCSNRRTFLDPVCIYFRQPVSVAKYSLASAGFRMAFPHDRGAFAMLRVSQAGASLSGVAFPYLTHLLLLGATFLTGAYILIYKTQNDPQSLAEMEDLRNGIVDEKLAPELTPKQEKELTGKAV